MNNKFRKNCATAVLVAGSLLMCIYLWENIELPSDSVMSDIKAKVLPLKVKNKQCFVNTVDWRQPSDVYSKTDANMIYFITPTYPRPEQVPELTRLGHTLMHVPRLHWIIADDEPVCSDEVLNILRRTGLPFTHLSSPKPFVYKTNNFPRGVSNRRAALDWIRENIHVGILYFGDDDNTYDLRLFEEIRNTKKVSMFPVGLIGGYGVSSPVVRDGKVVAFFDSWPGARMFPVDMAGFAVNIDFLKLSATMPYIAGLEESGFLVSLGVNIDDIEPLAENCSKVFVWHTKTNKFKKPTIRININKLEQFPKYESFVNLLREITSLGMATLNPVSGNRAQITRNRKSDEVLAVLE